MHDIGAAVIGTGFIGAVHLNTLRRLGVPVLGVLGSSPARGAERARALGVPFKTVRALAPGASVAQILNSAEWPDRKGAVVVVGHQPDLGQVAAFLLSDTQGDWTLKKGGLWWLTNRVRNDEAQVVVRAVVAPDLV